MLNVCSLEAVIYILSLEDNSELYDVYFDKKTYTGKNNLFVSRKGKMLSSLLVYMMDGFLEKTL